MAHVTYFVVVPYKLAKRGRLVDGQPQAAQSADQARRMAVRLRAHNDGVVAFSRSGDPETGDWDDAVILLFDGHVPNEVVGALVTVA